MWRILLFSLYFYVHDWLIINGFEDFIDVALLCPRSLTATMSNGADEIEPDRSAKTTAKYVAACNFLSHNKWLGAHQQWIWQHSGQCWFDHSLLPSRKCHLNWKLCQSQKLLSKYSHFCGTWDHWKVNFVQSTILDRSKWDRTHRHVVGWVTESPDESSGWIGFILCWTAVRSPTSVGHFEIYCMAMNSVYFTYQRWFALMEFLYYQIITIRYLEPKVARYPNGRMESTQKHDREKW